MNTRRAITLTALLALVIGACSPAATTAPSAGFGRTAVGRRIRGPVRGRPRHRPRQPRPTAEVLAPDPAEAVITGIEPGAEITFWTFFLSPTFDTVHQGHDRPIQGDLPGRQRQVGRPPGHVQGRPQQRVLRGHRPGRHQPLGQRGLGQRVRRQGPAARPRQHGPQARPGHLLPEPLEAAAHRRRELPVPLVPGPQRRADQQGDHGEGRRQRRRLPQDHRRPARPVRDDPREGRGPVRHPPDRQRPARPDGLRGQRQGLQRRRQVLRLQLARGRGVAADVRRHEQAPGPSTRRS